MGVKVYDLVLRCFGVRICIDENFKALEVDVLVREVGLLLTQHFPYPKNRKNSIPPVPAYSPSSLFPPILLFPPIPHPPNPCASLALSHLDPMLPSPLALSFPHPFRTTLVTNQSLIHLQPSSVSYPIYPILSILSYLSYPILAKPSLAISLQSLIPFHPRCAMH